MNIQSIYPTKEHDNFIKDQAETILKWLNEVKVFKLARKWNKIEKLLRIRKNEE